jgi:dTDP-glucose 4,6-dehydratase
MRIVVAGGAGFIGATLCRRLLQRGDEVVCVDNLITGSRANVAGLEAVTGFSLLEADVCAPVTVDGNVDAVINLASPASPVDFVPLALEILAVGSRGTENLLDLAESKGARFLQASTSEVYGEPLVHPQPEGYFGNVNPIGVRSVYDESKRFGEALIAARQRQRGTDVRIVRIFNTYGPWMRPDDGRLVSNFVTQALAGEPVTVHGAGLQTRSLCYVDDLAQGILDLLASDYTGPVNLGSADERTVLDIARLVIRLTDSPSEVVFLPAMSDDPTRRRPDLSLAREILGWCPSTTLEDGLARTVEWFAARAAGAARA